MRYDRVKNHIAHFVRSEEWSVHDELYLSAPGVVFHPEMMAIQDNRVVVVDTWTWTLKDAK